MYVNEQYIMQLLESAVHAGADIESLKNLAKAMSNWTDFAMKWRPSLSKENGPTGQHAALRRSKVERKSRTNHQSPT
jgi:hypothetical protein